jgi:hypothetical protein
MGSDSVPSEKWISVNVNLFGILKDKYDILSEIININSLLEAKYYSWIPKRNSVIAQCNITMLNHDIYNVKLILVIICQWNQEEYNNIHKVL